MIFWIFSWLIYRNGFKEQVYNHDFGSDAQYRAEANISFPIAFSSIPSILGSLRSSSASGYAFSFGIANVSTTAFSYVFMGYQSSDKGRYSTIIASGF